MTRPGSRLLVCGIGLPCVLVTTERTTPNPALQPTVQLRRFAPLLSGG